MQSKRSSLGLNIARVIAVLAIVVPPIISFSQSPENAPRPALTVKAPVAIPVPAGKVAAIPLLAQPAISTKPMGTVRPVNLVPQPATSNQRRYGTDLYATPTSNQHNG